MVSTPCFHCRGQGLDFCLGVCGTGSHKLQIKKILHAARKMEDPAYSNWDPVKPKNIYV